MGISVKGFRCKIRAASRALDLGASRRAPQVVGMGDLANRVQKFQRPLNMPKWRNGRRSGFKIRRPKGREGSSPSFGTAAPGRLGLRAHDTPMKPSRHALLAM